MWIELIFWIKIKALLTDVGGAYFDGDFILVGI